MRVVVVTPPAPFVPLEEAKAHLLVEHALDDVLIRAYIAAACEALDGPDGWLQRAVGQQALRLHLTGFPSLRAGLTLPCGPILAIKSVAYADEAGDDQTLTPILAGDVIHPPSGSDWPRVADAPEPVAIEYAAGYEAGRIPAPIKAAALLMVGDLYSNRETVSDRASAVPMSATVKSLLSTYRIWR